MAKTIRCRQCGRKELQAGHDLCPACYDKNYRERHKHGLKIYIQHYAQAYRQRPDYPEQRLTYDIRYTLKLGS